MKNYFLFIMVVSLVIILIAGCNIFDWTSENKDEAFYDGIELFNEGKFTQAKEKFAEAMQADPNRSDYRYYHAKAVVFEANLNFFAIAQNVIEIDTSSVVGLTLPLYTKDRDVSFEQDAANKTQIYSVSTICRNDIAPIYLEQTHGDIKAPDIYFDFSILSLSLALLRLRDTNSDGIIGGDDFYFEIVKSDDGKYTFNLLDVLDYLKDSDNQKSFNRTLLSTVGYVTDGVSSLLKVIGNDTTYFDQTDLTNLLENVSEAANRYQIDDDIDNDGDGLVDEETLNGIDDDGDGLIDEDVGIVP